MNMKSLLLLVLGISLSLTAFSQNKADAVVGVWETGNGKARVKIEKEGQKYVGRIVWLREPNDPTTGTPKVDKNNDEESLRARPLKGLRILQDFVYDEADAEWEDGTIYDAENGKTYKCVMTMKDANALNIRGYIGIPTFGRTDVWKRLQMPKK